MTLTLLTCKSALQGLLCSCACCKDPLIKDKSYDVDCLIPEDVLPPHVSLPIQVQIESVN